jgi:ABC-2 type transport system ATP-binding protein
MSIIVENLCKTYHSYQRGSTFGSILSSLFKRKYQDTVAVNNICFTITRGELVGFLGPNGAGKSTTLKMLSGIMHPTSGKATVLGYTPWRQRQQYVANIGAVFGQKSQLLWDIPPLDAFQLNKAIYNIPTASYKATLDQLVSLLDLSAIITQPTGCIFRRTNHRP